MGIYENMVERLDSEISKTEGSFATDNLRAVALELENILKTGIEYMPNRFFPLIAYGDDLTRAAENFGITRKGAVAASVMLDVIGNGKSNVKKGMQVMGDGVLFSCVADFILDSNGTGSGLFIADTAGVVGNVPPRVVNQFVASYPGLLRVVNPLAGYGGSDTENDVDLCERVRVKWATPSTGGNAGDYIRWALRVPGIIRARCVNPSLGNVVVYVVQHGNVETDETHIIATSEYIETQRPLGANVSVISGIGVAVNISATLKLLDGYVLVTVADEIKRVLSEYIASIAFNAASVSYGKLLNIVFADGVADVIDFKINGGIASISLQYSQFPYLGVVNFGA